MRGAAQVTTVSLNTALDHTLRLGRLRPGTVHVVCEERLCAGGKAVNVARALNGFGQRVRVLGLAGGSTGQRVRAAARAERIAATWFATAGETRHCTIVADADGRATVLNGRGPAVARTELAPLEAALLDRAAQGDVIVLSGSLPPAVDPDLYGRWTTLCRAAGARLVVVDAHGPALAGALQATPDLVKVNAAEFALVAAGRPLAEAAPALVAAGVGTLVVTDGERGAVGVQRHGTALRVAAPPVRTVNPTGSGDVFLAGLLSALLDGMALGPALCLAVAAGALNAASLGPGPSEATAARTLAATLAARPLAEAAGDT